MISKIIATYLRSERRLVVPQFGAFIRKDGDGVVVFVAFLKKDDGVLVRLLKAEYGVGSDETAAIINDFVSEIREGVENRGYFALEELGYLKQDLNGIYYLDSQPVIAGNVAPSLAKTVGPAQPGTRPEGTSGATSVTGATSVAQGGFAKQDTPVSAPQSVSGAATHAAVHTGVPSSSERLDDSGMPSRPAVPGVSPRPASSSDQQQPVRPLVHIPDPVRPASPAQSSPAASSSVRPSAQSETTTRSPQGEFYERLEPVVPNQQQGQSRTPLQRQQQSPRPQQSTQQQTGQPFTRSEQASSSGRPQVPQASAQQPVSQSRTTSGIPGGASSSTDETHYRGGSPDNGMPRGQRPGQSPMGAGARDAGMRPVNPMQPGGRGSARPGRPVPPRAPQQKADKFIVIAIIAAVIALAAIVFGLLSPTKEPDLNAIEIPVHKTSAQDSLPATDTPQTK